MTKFISIDDAYLANAIERYIFNIPRRQIDDHPAATEINFSFNFLSKEP
jgi:hypothetical protein